MISHFGDELGRATVRLQDVLNRKVSKHYSLQDRPFAIAVSNHDLTCDIEDVWRTVYSSAGFFTSRTGDRINNIRVSAVYVLLRWAPWKPEPCQIFELPNPNAQSRLRHNLFPGSTRLTPPSALTVATGG